MSIRVDRPIFIIGTGRSGTTMVFDLLHVHADLAWPSQHMVGDFYNKYDRRQRRLARLPVIGPYVCGPKQHRSRSEPYELWRRFDPGFNRPCRDLRAEDATARVINGMQKAVSEQLMDMRKARFLTKYTGWARMRYIDAIFPDALYLHVMRDGRAVAASLLTRKWWHGWHGPNQWRWGVLNEENEKIWQDSNQSFYVLAGLQWKILMENICEVGAAMGNRYKEVRYEAIMADPQKVFLDILQWASLDVHAEFMSHSRGAAYRDANEKWKTEIHPDGIACFEHLLGDSLHRFGYTN